MLLQVDMYGFNPTVDLGPDTVSCDAVLLDAGNPGATFLWSTGETSQSILAASTGLYWVEVIDLSGTSRDSIEVQVIAVPASPVLSDTTICGGESLTFTVPNTSDGVLWYDSPSGGNVLAFGDTYQTAPENTQSIYAARFNSSIVNLGLADTSFGTITYYSVNTWGEVFDVMSPLTLNAVYVYANKAVSFDLTIEDKDGTLIYTQAVSLNNSFVRTRIDIDLQLQVGQGYVMRAVNFSGSGGLAVSFPSVTGHPYTIPGLISNSAGVISQPSSRSFYFFDWEIGKPTCFSPREAVQITVKPTPTVDLGQDTIICRGTPYSLDASNTGGAYLWNDGSQGPTYTVQNTDTISVVVAIGDCIATDEIAVFVYDVPNESSLTDATVCGPQEISLDNSTSPAPNYTFWWSSSEELLDVSPAYNTFIADTFTILTENINSREILLGPKDLSVSNQVINDGLDIRGIQLNAFQDILIKSLAVFPVASQDFTFDIVLKNSSGIEISRHPQQLNPPYTKELLEVNIFVPKGDKYSLEVQNRVNGSLLRNGLSENVFPFEIDGVASISAATILTSIISSTQYNYLYDLTVIPYTTGCLSTKKTINVNVNLPLNMEDSIYSCTEFVLDPQLNAATYQWSSGATSSTLAINETGMYVLVADDGANCQVTDSSFVEIPKDAGLAEDGILCGDVLSTNYGPSANFNWSTGATTPSITVSNPGTYSVEVLEPRGCLLVDTIVISGFDSYPIVNLGQDFSACETALLDAGNPGLSYLWSTGETSQQINIVASGLYSVEVSNSNDCATIDTIGVSITPNPVAQFSIADTVIGGVSRRANFVNQSSFGSYLWDFGDGSTSTQISPSHTFADTGTYCIDLIVTDIQNSCGSDTFSKCVLVLQYPVGLEEDFWGTTLSIYPNPADKLIYLEFESPLADETELSLINLDGKIIHQKNLEIQRTYQVEALPLENLPPGIYLISLRNRGKILYRKIIVN